METMQAILIDVPEEAKNDAIRRSLQQAGRLKGAAATKEKAQQLEQNMLTYIKDKKIVTKRGIAEYFGISLSTTWFHLKSIKDKNPGNIDASVRGVYKWVDNSVPLVTTEKPKIKVPEPEKIERYKLPKNDEGICDYVASGVISKLDDIYGEFKPKEVYKFKDHNGVYTEYLVIRAFKGFVACVPISTAQPVYNPVYCVKLTGLRYVDCRRIMTKPAKFFTSKLFDLIDDQYELVKNKMSYLLGLETTVIETVEKKVEVPVEKIVEVEKPVEVIKEVPVEKIVEVEKSVDAIELALTRQRADIYEKMYNRLMDAFTGGDE